MTIDVEELREYANVPSSISDTVLNQYIDAAHLIVTEDMGTCSMSDDRRNMIELNIAAHFAQQAGTPGAADGKSLMKIGQSEERYAVLNDKNFGLSSGRFGQIAIMLDPCGILAGISTPMMKATFQVV